jgi:hypothetical protein
MHPFALTGHRNGANGMKAGDRVQHVINGRTGIVDEFLHDGDAFVTWDDDTYAIVKWNNLVPHG